MSAAHEVKDGSSIARDRLAETSEAQDNGAGISVARYRLTETSAAHNVCSSQ